MATRMRYERYHRSCNMFRNPAFLVLLYHLDEPSYNLGTLREQQNMPAAVLVFQVGSAVFMLVVLLQDKGICVVTDHHDLTIFCGLLCMDEHPVIVSDIDIHHAVSVYERDEVVVLLSG